MALALGRYHRGVLGEYPTGTLPFMRHAVDDDSARAFLDAVRDGGEVVERPERRLERHMLKLELVSSSSMRVPLFSVSMPYTEPGCTRAIPLASRCAEKVLPDVLGPMSAIRSGTFARTAL